MPIDARELKRAALIGLHREQQRIGELIQCLERELGTRGTQSASDDAAPARRKRRMSTAGRANIIAALKKRWAAVRAAKQAPKPERRAAAKANVGHGLPSSQFAHAVPRPASRLSVSVEAPATTTSLRLRS